MISDQAGGAILDLAQMLDDIQQQVRQGRFAEALKRIGG